MDGQAVEGTDGGVRKAAYEDNENTTINYRKQGLTVYQVFNNKNRFFSPARDAENIVRVNFFLLC